MEEWKSLVKAEFRIVGRRIDVNKITEILGINPTRAFNRNDRNAPLPISKSKGVWEIVTDYEISSDSHKQLSKLTSKLLSKVEELLQIKEKWNCYFVFDFAIEIYGNQYPMVYLDEKDIELFYQIGAFYDVDIYYMGKYDVDM